MPPLLACALLLAVPAGAHGDEPHGEAAAPAVRDGAAVASALSTAFEVVFVVPARTAAAPLHGTLYLADFATNAPIAGAALTLTLPGRADTLRVTATDAAGVYSVEGPALPTSAQSFVLRVGAGDARGLLLLALPAAPSAGGGESAGAGTSRAAGSEAPVPWTWFALVAVLGLGIALWLVRLARQRRQAGPSSPLTSP